MDAIERFKKELNGDFGEFSRKSALRDIETAEQHWKNNVYSDPNGIVRWKSNNHIPFDDMLYKMQLAGHDIDLELCDKVRAEEEAASIKRYIEAQKVRVYSEEELLEMQNEFGVGTPVVDAISGRRIL